MLAYDIVTKTQQSSMPKMPVPFAVPTAPPASSQLACLPAAAPNLLAVLDDIYNVQSVVSERSPLLFDAIFNHPPISAAMGFRDKSNSQGYLGANPTRAS